MAGLYWRRRKLRAAKASLDAKSIDIRIEDPALAATPEKAQPKSIAEPLSDAVKEREVPLALQRMRACMADAQCVLDRWVRL